MKFICIVAICLTAVGCGGHRDLTEYSLDEHSFDAEAMAKIEQESGINLPNGAKGLAFHHIPPIDPIVFAKIQLPSAAQDSITKQVEALTFSGKSFPEDFATDRCQSWPTALKEVVFSKQAFNNGDYMALYLVKENDDIILYIKYFTM
ncbi:MAG: hypothetical protein GFH27_549309n7 [Chloroflexi bacterium AL-W]|nr:hypothetical protein [Chloroflexi bacterium AL-N1]NOK69710.1 hypothetical protein [Chloroflexi bacterium AL-N10]NOK73686.1 hypothetical protein [Chloroflexi bacterium AL-N5]NOK83880.1 hypothetical protein [Chloroflexi bacterium AL-W]NOK88017.1 hypothetical protein [Chloroflexi bacterium AL-N15]